MAADAARSYSLKMVKGQTQKLDSVLLVSGAVLAIFAMVMLYNLNRQVDESQATSNSNLLYFTIRTEYELAMVLNEVNEFIQQEATLESLQQRYEILYGRFTVYEQSIIPQFTEDVEKVGIAFNRIREILLSIEEPVQTLQTGDIESARQIRSSLRQMRPLVTELGILGSRQQLGLFQAVDNNLTNSIRAGTLLLLSTLLFAVFTVGRFWYSMRSKARFNEVLESEIQARTNDLQITNSELKREIDERQRTEQKLAEKDQQILQAQKLEAIGRITAGIAHDFNNLLAVIMGNIELAKLNGDREKSVEFLDNALSASTLGSQLTRKLLAFGRRSTLSPEVFNLNKVVTELGDLFGRTVFESHQVRYEFDDNLMLVSIDRSLFENVLLNLVINARDASAVGGVITVRTSNVEIEQDEREADGRLLKAGKYVQIEVSDTGAGMTPEILNHAIEPFFSTKSEAEGSGLGLSMAYGFAQQSNGRISVSSESGQGTCVQMLFPHCQGQVVESATVASCQIPAKSDKAKKILVAEDDDGVRLMVIEQIQTLGFETVGVSNGQEAYELICSDESIDLLLTDVVMKGDLQGPQLADMALQLKPHLKVILMSGYPEGVRQQSSGAGAGFLRLTKPISLTTLSRALNSQFEVDCTQLVQDLEDHELHIKLLQ